METVSQNRAFGGVQGVYHHASASTGTGMTFSVYVPPHDDGALLPVVWYLSGLTCTHANVTDKGEFRRACAELGLIFVAPDTSPRGEGVADDPAGAYDFGLGATREVEIGAFLSEDERIALFEELQRRLPPDQPSASTR